MGAFNFITTKKIDEAYKYERFFGLIIYGDQGVGKSTYMLKVLYDVYGDWDIVFEHIIFSFDDLIDLIKKTREMSKRNERIKVIGWDDAGIYGHKYIYFRKREAVELVSAWIDVVRTRIASILITTINPFNLLKPIRESTGFKFGKVVRLNKDDDRQITVYNRTILPNCKTYVKKMYVDTFTARLPDNIYSRYLEMRKKFYEVAEARLVEIAEKGVDEKELNKVPLPED